MIKRSPLILCMGLLVVVPGCWRSKKGTVESTQPCCPAIVDEERTSIFDEQEGAFILEDNQNPFSPEGSIRLAEGDSLWEKDQQQGFETVFFEFNQYRIAPEQRAALERTMEQLRQAIAQGGAIVIEGHACNSAGSASYNIMLSEKRAQEVKKFLVARGLPSEKLKVVGRGFEMRKVGAGNREQQAPNRRVEFYVVRERTE